jgi:hypothetical protein
MLLLHHTPIAVGFCKLGHANGQSEHRGNITNFLRVTQVQEMVSFTRVTLSVEASSVLLQRVPSREQTLLHGFDFCSPTSINISTEGGRTGEENSRRATCREWYRHMARFPNLLHLASKFFSEDLFVPVSKIAKTCGEDNNIGVESAVVVELQPGLGEFLDRGVVLESDLSVDDQLTSPNICETDKGEGYLKSSWKLGLTEVVPSSASVRK